MRDHFEGVVVGNVESGHTKRDAFVKIVNSKCQVETSEASYVSFERVEDS